MGTIISSLMEKYNHDRTRLLDILQAVQNQYGTISEDMVDEIAAAMKIHRVEVIDVVSFYFFFRREGQGRTSIRIPRPACSAFASQRLAEKFQKILGIKMGSTTSDSQISLTMDQLYRVV